MSIFRVYDVRGIYGEDLTDEIMEKIGKAIGTFMIRQNIGKELILGKDIRKSSSNLSKAFIRGVLSTGTNVTDIGTSNVGLALFSGWKLKKDVISYITASHNPPEWNGIKFFDKNCIGFFSEQNEEIGKIVENEDFEKAEEVGKLKQADLKQEYIEQIKSFFNFEKNIKIVLDCGNGSTSLLAPKIFKSLKNIDLHVIFDNVDPMFGGRGADIKKENLQKLSNTVIERNADAGLAFDGDGDRVGVVDNKGDIVNTDQIAVIIGKDLLEKNKGKIISNIECSMIIEDFLEPLGGDVIRVPVGHTYIVQMAQKNNALFGSEFSGHYIIPSYFPFDDAIIAALKIVEILSKSNKRLSEIVESVPQYPQERVNLECSDKIKFKVVNELKKELSEKFDNVNTMDGVRVDFENGWILIRPSNTTPTIRLTVEAVDKNELEKIKSEFFKEIKSKIERLNN